MLSDPGSPSSKRGHRELVETATSAADRVDRALLDTVVARRARPLNLIMIPAAHSGSGGMPWIALIVLTRLQVDGGKRLNLGRASAGVLAAWAVAQAVKKQTDRKRPCELGEAVPLVDCPDGSSMPSDQAASAFAGAAIIASAIPKLRAPAYAGALCTGFSRIYAGVHYPSDVAAGATLGAIIGHFAARFGASAR